MRTAATKEITKAKFEGLAPSPEEAWCAFWDLADEAGECFVWRGKADRQGRAIYAPKDGSELRASHVAWAYDGRRLGAGEDLSPTCRRKLCIRPSHQAVRGDA